MIGQVGHGVSLAGQVDHKTEHIAKIVVDARLASPRGERCLGILDLAAQRIPQLLQLFVLHRAFELDGNLRKPIGAHRTDAFDRRHCLDRLFQGGSDFLLDFFRRRTGVLRGDQGVANGELGEFQLTHAQKRQGAACQQHHRH